MKASRSSNQDQKKTPHSRFAGAPPKGRGRRLLAHCCPLLRKLRHWSIRSMSEGIYFCVPLEKPAVALDAAVESVVHRVLLALAIAVGQHHHALPAPRARPTLEWPLIGSTALPRDDFPHWVEWWPTQAACSCCLGVYSPHNVLQQPTISCQWYYMPGCSLAMPSMHTESTSAYDLRPHPWTKECAACGVHHIKCGGAHDSRVDDIEIATPVCRTCLARMERLLQQRIDGEWKLTVVSLQRLVTGAQAPHALFHIDPLVELIVGYANPMARDAHRDRSAVAARSRVLPSSCGGQGSDTHGGPG